MPQIHDFSLNEMKQLNMFLLELRRKHGSSIEYYKSEDGLGFCHQPDYKQTSSLSSSSTCITSLTRAGLWNDKHSPKDTARIAKNLMERPWKSGELSVNNPYSVSFVIEGILNLNNVCPGYNGAIKHLRILKKRAVPALVEDLRRMV